MKNRRTDAQMMVRQTFKSIAKQWHMLPQEEMNAYIQYANNHTHCGKGKKSGFNCFMMLNMKYREINQDKFDLVKPPNMDYFFPIILCEENVVLPREKPLLKIRMKTLMAKPLDKRTLKVYVMATRQTSPGCTVAKGGGYSFLATRLFKTDANGDCVIDVTREYKKKFNDLGEYVKVFFKFCLVNKLTGESSLFMKMTMRTKHSSEL